MKRGLAAFILALAGCTSPRADKPLPIPPPPAPVQQIALMQVWQAEVAEDLAIFKAIRPSLSGPPTALNLYDSATQGLASLSGEPTAKAIDTFRGYVDKPDQNRLDALRAEKVALDKKTDELEKKANEEERKRLLAESEATAAREDARQAKVEARKSEAVSTMTKVGAIGAAVGLLALLFGHFLNISKLTAGIVIAASLGIAVAAPWLIDLAEMRWVITFLLAFLGLDVALFVIIKTWRYFRPCNETPSKDQGGV